jgi:hypothetical protein
MRRNLIAYVVSQLPILARDAEPISRMDISDKHSISSKDRSNYCRLQKNFLRAEFFVPLIKNGAYGLKEDTPRALNVHEVLYGTYQGMRFANLSATCMIDAELRRIAPGG